MRLLQNLVSLLQPPIGRLLFPPIILQLAPLLAPLNCLLLELQVQRLSLTEPHLDRTKRDLRFSLVSISAQHILGCLGPKAQAEMETLTLKASTSLRIGLGERTIALKYPPESNTRLVEAISAGMRFLAEQTR